MWCLPNVCKKWTGTGRFLLCNFSSGVCREPGTHMKSPAAPFYPTERSLIGVDTTTPLHRAPPEQVAFHPRTLSNVFHEATRQDRGGILHLMASYVNAVWLESGLHEMMDMLQDTHASHSWIKLLTVCASKKADSWTNQPITCSEMSSTSLKVPECNVRILCEI